MQNRVNLVLIIFLFVSAQLWAEADCVCEEPVCNGVNLIPNISRNVYLAHLQAVDLMNPVSDMYKHIRVGDFRFLTLWDDGKINFSKSYTEDEFLVCTFGFRFLSGFKYIGGSIDLGDKDIDGYYDKFKRYVFKYNEALWNEISKGKLSKKIKENWKIPGGKESWLSESVDLSVRSKMFKSKIKFKKRL